MKQYTIEEIRTYLGNKAEEVNVYKWLDYAPGFTKFVMPALLELEQQDTNKPSYSELEERVKFLETALNNLATNVSRGN